MELVLGVADWLLQQRSAELERIVSEMMPSSSTSYVRLAGLSGTFAIAMGAYGAHAFHAKKPEMKLTFDTGNRYHLLHSVALLAVPLTKRPNIVGPLIITGILVFSGTCYHQALTESKRLRKMTPFGGMMLMAGWAAMVL